MAFDLDEFVDALANTDRVRVLRMFEEAISSLDVPSIEFIFLSIVQNGDAKLLVLALERKREWGILVDDYDDLLSRGIVVATNESNFNAVLCLEKEGGNVRVNNDYPFRIFSNSGHLIASKYLLSKGVKPEVLSNARFNASVYKKDRMMELLGNK